MSVGEIERLRLEVERLTEALEQIAEWARAYPLTVFPEPDFAKACVLLEAGGITLDAVSASNMRHVVMEVAAIARRALAAVPPDLEGG
jgi:hypothetical protein